MQTKTHARLLAHAAWAAEYEAAFLPTFVFHIRNTCHQLQTQGLAYLFARQPPSFAAYLRVFGEVRAGAQLLSQIRLKSGMRVPLPPDNYLMHPRPRWQLSGQIWSLQTFSTLAAE
jgi:hypothetical protein